MEEYARQRKYILDMRVKQGEALSRKKMKKMQTVKVFDKPALIFANDANSNEDSFGAWETADDWVVDARRCEHPFGVVQCDRRRTLFALYNELSAQALNRPNPQQAFAQMLPQKLQNPTPVLLNIAKLFSQLYQENPNTPINLISPHTFLVSTKGTLALVLKKDAHNSVIGRDIGGAFEKIRWSAPELKFEDAPTLASDIFSYALVAWQIATPMHEIPFAEVDAQSASTRMATGYRPVTQGLRYELVNLFDNAWKQEPDERSSIQDIIESLQAVGGGGDKWENDSTPNNANAAPGVKWKKPEIKKDNTPLTNKNTGEIEIDEGW